ncbi:MAG: hypothetical protein U9R27_01050 [Campylobacterota bacterium]|nr:hypothetical protein [Campylobacterota bacterium]
MAQSQSLLLENIDTQSAIPNFPTFFVKYKGEELKCYPVSTIKKKSRKDLIKYYCLNRYIKLTDSVNKQERESVKDQDQEHGQNSAERFRIDIQDQIDGGSIYTVRIPKSDARNSTISAFIARQQLNDRYYGVLIDALLPAKLYISLRPQFASSADEKGLSLRNGGSRGGFFYYYQFTNDIELMLQYEAGVSWNSDTPFINISNAEDSSRRLSYLSLQYDRSIILIGKAWSPYYDIAGFTDHYMAFGSQASGAFNAGTDGGVSGTGRADKVMQIQTNWKDLHAKLQLQYKHNAHSDIDIDYDYGVAGSLIYKGWSDIRAGVAVSYAKFNDITAQMVDLGIEGADLSTIAGVIYTHENFSANALISYTKNHMTDDQGIYFDSIGSELYMRYDIGDSWRLSGGFNYLIPKDNSYESEYSIKNSIFSLQYTFGKRDFDDLIYIEFSLPSGKLADGKSLNMSVAVGIRYLLSR